MKFESVTAASIADSGGIFIGGDNGSNVCVSTVVGSFSITGVAPIAADFGMDTRHHTNAAIKSNPNNT